MNARELVMESVKKVIGSCDGLTEQSNMIRYGVSSLQVMKISGLLRKNGIRLTFADLMENKTLGEWISLAECRMTGNAVKAPVNVGSTRKEAYPLTDVQYSYWVGRENDQPMGGVDCHAYYEFDGMNVDAAKLEEAWNIVISSHPMLRTRFTNDGRQVTMDKPFSESFKKIDLSALDEAEQEKQLLQLRKEMSHRRFDLEAGETAGMRHCILSGGRSVTLIDFALIVCDVQSIKIIFRDLAAYCKSGKRPDVQKDWDFGRYIEKMRDLRSEEEKEASVYWKKREKEMALRPELPIKKKPESITSPKYTHHTASLSEKQWASIKKRAADENVTPAMVLLTAYSQTLHCWTSNDSFLINLPLFDRCDDLGSVSDVVADFTTLLLAEQDLSKKRTFSENIRKVSGDFIRDMRYAAYNGVQVQRDLQALYPGQRDFAPVVFACNIGMELINDDFAECIGDIRYMVSQTPQVWIDCQLFERSGELVLVWDTADELFPEQMTDDMFDTFMRYLNTLSDEKTDWNSFCSPEIPTRYVRKTLDELKEELPHRELLTDGLVRYAAETPDKTALYFCESQKKVTYSELYGLSLRIAAALQEHGFKKGDLAAIILERGIGQIAAAYGILLAGGCYVPISYGHPDKRIEKIISSMKIGFAITDSRERFEGTDAVCIAYDEAVNSSFEYSPTDVTAEDSAYIIMTSGSTGMPKGVEIQHGSAYNTIYDINERAGVTSDHGIIGVSATDFDLSVYDIFGMSAAGGTLYLLSQQNAKDADAWVDIILENNITLWNSVPILFDMLLTAAEKRGAELPIKTVMLSGDWIGIPLAKRCYKMLPQSVIFAMGGATEASIWSNLFIVPKDIPEDWKSIPYGFALRSQMYRIVDRDGRDRPDWAEGELLIGGTGVAKSYYNDPELTKRKFTTENGIIWYHTGDNGRFWDDGAIEFLGRKDNQIKVSGHRIELGEIEYAAVQCRGISRAAAQIYKAGGSARIALFYTADEEVSEKELTEQMKKYLPNYMLPKKFIHTDDFSVTSNGKLDRKALIVHDEADVSDAVSAEFTETESKLSRIWESSLDVKVGSSSDDFFELGGNSLKATNMLYDIEEVFSVKFRIGMIFRYPSLGDMAAQIDKLSKGSR